MLPGLECHDRATACPAGCVALAVRAMVCGEFEASLRKLIFPTEFPAFCGAKVTAKETLCPAATLTGKVIPLTENPSPFQSAEVTATPASPAVMVPVMVDFCPTGTWPKLKLTGDTAS